MLPRASGALANGRPEARLGEKDQVSLASNGFTMDHNRDLENLMTIPAWLHAPTTARITRGCAYMVESPADPFIERWEAEPDLRTKLFLARRSLRNDPGCIEAHLLLAPYAPHDYEAHAHLNKAVKTGSQLWTPAAAHDDDFTWWGFAATRPYMRAMAALADLYAEFEDVWSANAIRMRLLAMNPNDNQGIRFLMGTVDLGHAGGDDMDGIAAPRM